MGHQHSSIQDDLPRPSCCARIYRKIRLEKAVKVDAAAHKERRDEAPIQGLAVSIQPIQVKASATLTPPNQERPKQDEIPVKALLTTNTIPLTSTSASSSKAHKCAARSDLPRPTLSSSTETDFYNPVSHTTSSVEDTRDETDVEDNMKRLSMTLSKLEYNLQHWDEYAASSVEARNKDQSTPDKMHLGYRVLEYKQDQSGLSSNNPYRTLTTEKEQEPKRVPSGSTLLQQINLPKPPIRKVPAIETNTNVDRTLSANVDCTLNANVEDKGSLRQPSPSIIAKVSVPLGQDTAILEHPVAEANSRIGEVVLKDLSQVHPALRTVQQEQPKRCKSISELLARLPTRFSSSIVREPATTEAIAAETTKVAEAAKMVEAAEAVKAVKAAEVAEVAEEEARREQEKFDYGLAFVLQEEEERARATLVTSQPPFKECAVCCESLHPLFFPASPPSSQCTHKSQTCETCLQRWIASQMDAKSWEKICCPQCTRELSHDDVRRASDQKTFERYDRFSMMGAVRAMPHFSWCLRPGCNSGQENRPGADYMRCASCKYQQCLRHKMAWHSGLTCLQYDKRLQAEMIKSVRDNENLASEKFIEQNTKTCPTCKVAIEKSYGCDHMTCGKCYQEFCYLCLVKYEDIRRGGSLAHAIRCKHRGHTSYQH